MSEEKIYLLEPALVRPTKSYRSELKDQEWDGFKRTIELMGCLEPIIVGIDNDREYYCKSGHRRRLACEELGIAVPAVIRNGPKSVVVAIVENVQRRQLRPAELAEALTECRESYDSNASLARDVGISESYAANLIRLRKNLHNDLWELFYRHGEGIDWIALSEVAKLPKEHQLDAWEKIKTERGGAKRKRSRKKDIQKLLEESAGKTGQYWKGWREALKKVMGIEE